MNRRTLFLLLIVALVGFGLGRLGRTGPDTMSPDGHAAHAEDSGRWTCSMHPQIQMGEPGSCPICGMDLVPVEGGGGMEDDEPVLEMSAAARKLAEIQTARVERRFGEAEVRLVGKIDVDESLTRTVTAWVGGRLERLYIDFTGVRLRRGDHMVELYSPQLVNAQEELLQALRAVRGERDAPRLLDGLSAGTLEAAREKLRLWGLSDRQIADIEERGEVRRTLTIYSPMDGVVLRKHAVEGEYVDTGSPLYEIADLSRLWIRIDAYESDLQWLRFGQRVNFTAEALPGRAFEGRVSFIDPVLDPTTRTAKIRVTVQNAEGLLKPGMFVRSVVKARVAAGGKVIADELAGKWMCPMHPEVIADGPGSCGVCDMPLERVEDLGFRPVGAEEPPLMVPATAPLLTGERAVVYVQREDAERPTFEGRQVVLGPRMGDHYVVQEGLAEGERVVTHGAFKIDSALQIQAKPSMMSPTEERVSEPSHRGTKTVLDAPEAFREQLTALLEASLDLGEALAADDESAGRTAAAQLRDALAAVDMALLAHEPHLRWMELLGQLRPAVDRMDGAGIGDLRVALDVLTPPLTLALKQFGVGDSSTVLMHCPMAFDDRGADWLQRGRTVANPYYGSRMLRCGTVVETLAAGGGR